MLTGYNTDFKFQGKIYHVQTEDGGINSPAITSLLYHQGAILASRKTSYADILKADCLEDVVRELMMAQHKQMIRDLMHGKLDVNAAPHEAAYQTLAPRTSAGKPAAALKAAPVGEKVPEKPAAAATPQSPKQEEKGKNLDDIILDFLAQEQKERNEQS
ncbi:MAG TPA: hypothetical protein VF888_02025 [Nitrospirota bacterium]